MGKIRVVLIEDNRLLRDGLSAMIDAQDDMETVAAVSNGENIVDRLKHWRPRVVLLDLGLRTQNSLRVVEVIRTA